VVLFKAELAETLYLYAGATLGWDQFVTQPIRITEIGGSHFSMMAEPGVSELIEAVRRELARLDGEEVAETSKSTAAGRRSLPRGLSPAA